MPGIDGFEVCRQLKAHTETCGIQVVPITCLKDPEGKIKGMALGAGNGQEVGTITASIGIATCPDNANDAEALIRQADAMRYRAKGTGKNRIVRPE